MKKIISIVLLVLMMAFALTACGGKEVSKIEIAEGLKYEFTVGETPDFSAVKANITYNDDTTETITADKLTFSALDTSTPGTKQLTITYEGFSVTVDVTVKPASNGGNNGGESNNVYIYGVELPSYISDRENVLKNNFTVKNAPYYVGDDNPYVLTLSLIVLDENDNIVTDPTPYVSASQVYLVDEAGNTTLVGAEYVTINENNHSFDFTEEAIGKTFKIVTRPSTGFASGQEADFTRYQIVTVVDGYNVFRAKELNLITNADHDIDGDGDMDQLAAVSTFLTNNGIVRPEKLSGIVLHGNMNVQQTDLPEEYFVTYNDGSTQKKDLYDLLSVYYHQTHAGEPEFSIYGNYFTIYTYDIPNVAIQGFGRNTDEFSNSELFHFIVADSESMDNYTFDHSNYNVNLIGLGMRDDDPNADNIEASARANLSLGAIKTRRNTTVIENCSVEAFFTSLTVEADDQTVTVSNTKFYNSWQNHVFLIADNEIQVAYENEAPRVGHQPITVNVVNSTIAKCGGPVFISQTKNPTKARNANSKAILNIDSASDVHSYVTGEEAWFVASGVNSLAVMIRQMSTLISLSASQQAMAAGYVYNDVNKTGIDGVAMNLIYVNMVSGTNPITGEDVDGKVTVNGATVFNHNDGENLLVETLAGALPAGTPIFQSSTGAAAFTDGSTGVYGVDFTTGQPCAPAAEFFQGDYIGLYYMGLGILLEYN